jgi:parallel beta-helix repeat protein
MRKWLEVKDGKREGRRAGQSAILICCLLLPFQAGPTETARSNELSQQKGMQPLPATASVRIANEFPGNDLGAQINSADADLGSSPGEIWVTRQGTVATRVKLSPLHTLRLAAPTVWKADLALSSGDRVVGEDEPSLITSELAQPGALILGNSASDIDIEHLSAVRGAGLPEGNTLVDLAQCERVRISKCRVKNLQLFNCHSAAASYALVTDKSSCQDIQVTDNVALSDSTDKTSGSVITLAFTWGAVVQGNTIVGFSNGVEWWGGDANYSRDGAASNPRKAGNITISNNSISKTGAGGIWGGMASGVTVSGNTVDTCGDVCLDSEGSDHIIFTGNIVKDGRNGAIATFFYNRDVTIAGNTVISTAPEKPLLSIFNSSQSSEYNKDIRIADNRFDCHASGICVLTSRTGPAERLVVTGNSLRDVRIDLTANNQHYVEVSHNDLVFDLSSAEPFNAIDVEHTNSLRGEPGFVKVVQNTIACQSPQPKGSAGIYVLQDDYNASPTTLVADNEIIGSKPFPVDIAVGGASKNPSIKPLFLIRNNLMGGGRLFRLDQPTPRSSVKLEGNHLLDLSPFPGEGASAEK